MPTLNLLYEREYRVNDHFTVQIPTVGDVLRNEEAYYSLISTFTAMPVDLMLQLDEIGVDFSTINEWELFLITFSALRQADTSMVLGGLDLSRFEYYPDQKTGMTVLVDPLSGAVIDRLVLNEIASVLRKIHYIKKDRRKPGNDEAKRYMLEQARKKSRRKSKRTQESVLEQNIVALVNTEQFKYDYDSVQQLTIYQFNQSLYQIIHKIDFDNRMFGIYSGTVSAKDIKQDDLNWLVHKHDS